MKKSFLRFQLPIFTLILTACAVAASAQPTPQTVQSPLLRENESPETASTTPTLVPQQVPPNPFPTNVRIDDDTEYHIPHMLGFDGIPPIYNPRFVSAQESPLVEEELVMGLAIDGEAKAYPVSVLRFREMVNDDIAGWPVLVSW